MHASRNLFLKQRHALRAANVRAAAEVTGITTGNLLLDRKYSWFAIEL